MQSQVEESQVIIHENKLPYCQYVSKARWNYSNIALIKCRQSHDGLVKKKNWCTYDVYLHLMMTSLGGSRASCWIDACLCVSLVSMVVLSFVLGCRVYCLLNCLCTLLRVNGTNSAGEKHWLYTWPPVYHKSSTLRKLLAVYTVWITTKYAAHVQTGLHAMQSNLMGK